MKRIERRKKALLELRSGEIGGLDVKERFREENHRREKEIG